MSNRSIYPEYGMEDYSVIYKRLEFCIPHNFHEPESVTGMAFVMHTWSNFEA